MLGSWKRPGAGGTLKRDSLSALGEPRRFSQKDSIASLIIHGLLNRKAVATFLEPSGKPSLSSL